jgi:hypothetical protein
MSITDAMDAMSLTQETKRARTGFRPMRILELNFLAEKVVGDDKPVRREDEPALAFQERRAAFIASKYTR